MKIKINGNWLMNKEGDSRKLACNVPCSVYKTLLEYDKIENPYLRENEYVSTEICDDNYDFSAAFTVGDDVLENDNISLVFDGIDTLSEVYLNGKKLGATNNMHRIWKYDVKGIIVSGENKLLVKILSPNNYIAKKQEERPLWGVDSTMAGYTHLRKAHCMFGWDWGPKLPDMGIWRDVSIECWSDAKLEDCLYSQEHGDDSVRISCKVNFKNANCDKAVLTIKNPNGIISNTVECQISAGDTSCVFECDITNPQLWWANGYGQQPLYVCSVKIMNGDDVADEIVERIGLRTLTISQDKDEWGEEFCFKLNGKKIFAMGANYIPKDQIVTTCTEKRTRELLEQCIKANYNCIRVWGGGYYPDKYFYDFCDENGLIVWQDFMFACSAYLLTEEFEQTVREEIKDNIIRLRNHASLGMWCGNNEIESAWEGWGLPEDPESKADYLRQFEDIIPEIAKEYSPDIFYWCSSPSSGGGFKNSSSNHAGDMHYWDVWHCLKPIEAFREFYYRFCSEYGFESVPCLKTMRTVADEELGDFNLMSPVMEAHQKCVQGNEKIMFYLAQMVRYPYTFERLIYSSQLLQADCIRSNVEHMRRARGRCMGSVYWQVNDSNPVISWSSIDYYNRWKGLHYYAKRFYNPLLISVDDTNSSAPIINICNETLQDCQLRYTWSLRNNQSEILLEGGGEFASKALSAKDVVTLDLGNQLVTMQDKRQKYLEYKLFEGEKLVSQGTTIFVRPKEFEFLNPYIAVSAKEEYGRFALEFKAQDYAKSVCLDLEADDCIFSDNWFDIHGNESVKIFVEKSDCSRKMTLDEFMDQLTWQSNFEG